MLVIAIMFWPRVVVVFSFVTRQMLGEAREGSTVSLVRSAMLAAASLALLLTGLHHPARSRRHVVRLPITHTAYAFA